MRCVGSFVVNSSDDNDRCGQSPAGRQCSASGGEVRPCVRRNFLLRREVKSGASGSSEIEPLGRSDVATHKASSPRLHDSSSIGLSFTALCLLSGPSANVTASSTLTKPRVASSSRKMITHRPNATLDVVAPSIGMAPGWRRRPRRPNLSAPNGLTRVITQAGGS